MTITLHDDPLPEGRDQLWEKGGATQIASVDAFYAGFLQMASARAVTFHELMLCQAWQISQLVARIVAFAKDEQEALRLGEAILKAALESLPAYIADERRKRLTCEEEAAKQRAKAREAAVTRAQISVLKDALEHEHGSALSRLTVKSRAGGAISRLIDRLVEQGLLTPEHQITAAGREALARCEEPAHG